MTNGKTIETKDPRVAPKWFTTNLLTPSLGCSTSHSEHPKLHVGPFQPQSSAVSVAHLSIFNASSYASCEVRKAQFLQSFAASGWFKFEKFIHGMPQSSSGHVAQEQVVVRIHLKALRQHLSCQWAQGIFLSWSSLKHGSGSKVKVGTSKWQAERWSCHNRSLLKKVKTEMSRTNQSKEKKNYEKLLSLFLCLSCFGHFLPANQLSFAPTNAGGARWCPRLRWGTSVPLHDHPPVAVELWIAWASCWTVTSTRHSTGGVPKIQKWFSGT